MKECDFSDEARANSAFLRESFAQSGAAAIASTRAATLPCGAILAVPVTRVLTLHPGGLSDFLLSLPALHALRESFPGARICGVMRPALAGLLHHSPLIDDVFPRAPGGLSQQTALMLQLRAGHFDIAVALSPSRSTTILAWSSGAATRVGFATAKMDALLTHRVEAEKPFGVEAYLELARAVGCAARQHDARGLLSLSPAAPISAARILEKHGVHGDFLVAAPAGASAPRGEEASASRSHFAIAARAGRRDNVARMRRSRSATEQAESEKTAREYSHLDFTNRSHMENANDDARPPFAPHDAGARDPENAPRSDAAREYSHSAAHRNEHASETENDEMQRDETKRDEVQNDARRNETQDIQTKREQSQRDETTQELAPHDALFEARRAGEKALRDAAQRFAPPAPRELKEWPAVHWARSLDELSERLPIVLLGNAPSPVAPLMENRVIDLGGRLDLPTMAALCGSARLFLGTDGGLMHLAAAQETPIVALFGPTDARRTGPRGASTRVLRFDIECAPCNRRDCLWRGDDERACMTRLMPEEVVRAARELIGL